MPNEEHDAQLRRAAQSIWRKGQKRDEGIASQRDKERVAEAAKVARLRELRLAKEAAERETAEKAAPLKRRKSRGS